MDRSPRLLGVSSSYWKFETTSIKIFVFWGCRGTPWPLDWSIFPSRLTRRSELWKDRSQRLYRVRSSYLDPLPSHIKCFVFSGCHGTPWPLDSLIFHDLAWLDALNFERAVLKDYTELGVQIWTRYQVIPNCSFFLGEGGVVGHSDLSIDWFLIPLDSMLWSLKGPFSKIIPR